MILKQASFLTDENIALPIITYLRSLGNDVLDVKEALLGGSSDHELLALAHAQNRIIITHDSDFGTLAIAQRHPYVGIVYLKPGHIHFSQTIRSLEALFQEVPRISIPCIITVRQNEGMVRIRIRPDA